MTALRKGVDPDSTTYVSRSPTIIDDPHVGHDRGQDLRRQRRRHDDACAEATLKSDNSVYIQLALDLGPEEVKKTARDMGITTKLDGYPAEALGGLDDRRLAARDGDARTRRSPPAATAAPTAITKIGFPDGHVEQGKKLPQRFRVKRTKAFSGRRHLRGDEDPRAERRRRHGHARRRSAARRPARPARPTTTPTPGSSASRRAWRPPCGSAIPTADIEMNTEFHGGPSTAAPSRRRSGATT